MKRLKNMRNLIPAALAACALIVAVTAPGCSGCGGKAPLAFVPQDAVAVVLIPSIKDASKGLKEVIDKFRNEAPVKAAMSKGKAEMVKELGFDPEKPETMKAKGIDPDKGVAFSVGGDGKSFAAVVGVTDQKAMEKFMREMANKAMSGGATFKEKTVGGVKATLLTVQGSERVYAAWVHVKGHVIICPNLKDQKVAEYAAKIATQETSIKKNKQFHELKGKLGKHQAMFYVDGPALKKMMAANTAERLKTASEWMKKALQEQQETTNSFLAYYSGQAAGIHLSKKGVTLKGYVAIPSAKGKIINEIMKGAGKAPDFGEYIGPDALVVSRMSLSVKKLWDKVRELIPPRVKRRLYRNLDGIERTTKINVEKDLMGLVAGRFAFALFAPKADLIKQGFSFRNPMKALAGIPLLGMAQVTDPKKAAEMMSTMERIMTRQGVDVRTKSEGESKTYYVGPSESPLVAWTVAKDLAIVATGGRLAKTLALVNKGGDNVLGQIENSRAKKLFKKPEGMVAHFNLAKTVDLVRSLKLPAEYKLMLSSATSTMGKFDDVTWGAEVEDEGILGELSVRFK